MSSPESDVETFSFPGVLPDLLLSDTAEPISRREILGLTYLGGSLRYTEAGLAAFNLRSRQCGILAMAGASKKTIKAYLLQDRAEGQTDARLYGGPGSGVVRYLRSLYDEFYSGSQQAGLNKRSGLLAAMLSREEPLVSIDPQADPQLLPKPRLDDLILMRCIARGYTSERIANQLNTSFDEDETPTDKVHINWQTEAMQRRLEIPNRELVVLTYALGRTTLDPGAPPLTDPI